MKMICIVSVKYTKYRNKLCAVAVPDKNLSYSFKKCVWNAMLNICALSILD